MDQTKFLLQNGADRNLECMHGFTPFQLAYVGANFLRAPSEPFKEIMKILEATDAQTKNEVVV